MPHVKLYIQNDQILEKIMHNLSVLSLSINAPLSSFILTKDYKLTGINAHLKFVFFKE